MHALPARVRGAGNVRGCRQCGGRNSAVSAGPGRPPVFPDTLQEPLGRDVSYNLFFVRYAGDSARYWHAEFWSAMRGDAPTGQALKELRKPVNGVLAGTGQTYPDTTGSRAP